MKRVYFLLLALLTFSVYAQENQNQLYKFRVYLKDKGNVEYSLDNPEEFLTPTAIERRQRQGVTIDSCDLPISTDYFRQLQLAGGEVMSFSKWFKTVVVQLGDSAQIDDIVGLPFVESAQYVWKGQPRKVAERARPRLSAEFYKGEEEPTCFFGLTKKQFEMHGAKQMLKSGFMGRGINIAVIDAGFTNVDVIPQFGNANIKEFKSFVPDGMVYLDSDHGTRVLSTISAYEPKMMIGSAPYANFYLFNSEDVNSEFPVEEDFWVRAVEYADSVGVDILNSSLGYNSFDDKSLSYSHSVLDGKTALMSLAADKAYHKGMIVVTSAGNEGRKEWRKVSVPGDAEYALTVGAVSSDSVIAGFSSTGYTDDRRLKPDLVSVGQGTFTIGRQGRIGPANGTSFSSPFMTGLVASLWSVDPSIDRGALLDIIKESSDRYHEPDSVYGRGIPNMAVALEKVLQQLEVHDKHYADNQLLIEQINKDRLDITLLDSAADPEVCSVNVLDEKGVLLSKHQFVTTVLSIEELKELKKTNQYIHFLIMMKDEQRTIRFKL